MSPLSRRQCSGIRVVLLNLNQELCFGGNTDTMTNTPSFFMCMQLKFMHLMMNPSIKQHCINCYQTESKINELILFRVVCCPVFAVILGTSHSTHNQFPSPKFLAQTKVATNALSGPDDDKNTVQDFASQPAFTQWNLKQGKSTEKM